MSTEGEIPQIDDTPKDAQSSPPPSEPIPVVTPQKIQSRIPVFNREQYMFQTPSCRQDNRLIENQKTCGRVSKRKLTDFIDRIDQVEAQRKAHLERIWKEEEAKKAQEIETTRILPHSKKLTQAELEQLTERLVPKTPMKPVKEEEEVVVPKTPSTSNSKIFNRLFLESTVKKPKREPIFQEEEPKEEAIVSDKSKRIVSRKQIKKVREAFGDAKILTREQLFKILEELGIVDSTLTDAELDTLDLGLSHFETGSNTFAAQRIKDDITDAIKGKKRQRFHKFIVSRIVIKRANTLKKAGDEVDMDEDKVEVKHKKMTKETLERLSAVRESQSVEDDEEVRVSAMSEVSKRILEKSEKGKSMKKRIEERDLARVEEQKERMSKIAAEKEERELAECEKPKNLGRLPEFYSKLPDERRQRKRKDHEEQGDDATFRAKTIPYEEYKRRRELAEQSAAKPKDWDATVERIRLGRVERNAILNALDIRKPDPDVERRLRASCKRRESAKSKSSLSVSASSEVDGVEDIDDFLGI